MDFYNEIYTLTRGYRYVSFDIYDTLIYRATTKPNDIFEIVGHNMSNSPNCIKHFYWKRLLAVRKAAQISHREDITIEDIYSCINAPNTMKKNYMDMENKIESDLAIPNFQLIKILKELKREGKVIIIITDMYLKRETLNKILTDAGIVYDHMFISGEEGLTKSTGHLFEFVLKDLSIEASELVHIGNDSLKDIINANIYGIKTFQIVDTWRDDRSCNLIKKRSQSYDKSLLRNYCYYHITNSKNEKLGYSCLGPFLVGMCRWIHTQVAEKHNSHIWFVSREGYLIKKIYNKMYPQELSKTHYICINKNVMRLPTLYNSCDVDTFLSSIPAKRYIQIGDIVKYLQIEHDSIYKELYNKFGDIFNIIFKYKDAKENKLFNEVFRFLVKVQRTEIKNQAFYLKQYIRQNASETDTIYLVNNSHNGNGQYLLEKYIRENNIDLKVIGLQLVKSTSCRKKNILCKAWLEDNRVSQFKQYSFIRNCLFFEHMLFENCGTALKLQEIDGKIVVIHKCQSGQNNEVLFKIQDSALAFAGDFCSSEIGRYLSDSSLFSPLLYYFRNPTLCDVRFVNGIYDDDDIFGESSLIGIPTEKIGKNHFKLFELRKTGWIEGYLVACGIKKIIRRLIAYLIYLRSTI